MRSVRCIEQFEKSAGWMEDMAVKAQDFPLIRWILDWITKSKMKSQLGSAENVRKITRTNNLLAPIDSTKPVTPVDAAKPHTMATTNRRGVQMDPTTFNNPYMDPSNPTGGGIAPGFVRDEVRSNRDLRSPTLLQAGLPREYRKDLKNLNLTNVTDPATAQKQIGDSVDYWAKNNADSLSNVRRTGIGNWAANRVKMQNQKANKNIAMNPSSEDLWGKKPSF